MTFYKDIHINDADLLVSDDREIVWSPTEMYNDSIINPKFVVIQTFPRGVLPEYDIRASAKRGTHFDIDQWGDIHQHASLIDKVWHAGHSHWQGYYGLNSCSIGIGLSVPGLEVTMEQRDTLKKVLPLLIERYKIRDVVSISQVSSRPDYASIPYELTTLTDLGNSNSGGRYVVTHDIDVYAGPHPEFEIINRLHRGDGVSLLKTNDEWSLVSFQKKDNEYAMGWVHDTFIKRV